MKYNIENRIKDNALVNLTDFENAIDLYEDGEMEKALELVFGLITLGLGGEFETDDREIRRLLRNREYTVAKSNKAYCNKVGSDETRQRTKLQLDDIAEMMANGATQQIIADSLCVSLDTIKYRVKVMKEKYPALYTESVKKCKKVGVSGSNDNVNDNDNEKEKENGNENLWTSPSKDGKSPSSPNGELGTKNQVIPFPSDKAKRDLELLHEGVNWEAYENATTKEEQYKALGF